MGLNLKTIKSELIGREVRVINSRNEALIGIQGRVIDETRNTLVIETSNGVKKVLKNEVTLKIDEITFKGSDLIGKFTDRIKKRSERKRW